MSLLRCRDQRPFIFPYRMRAVVELTSVTSRNSTKNQRGDEFQPLPQGHLARMVSSSRSNAVLCALFVGACILLVHPFANVPFGDDFSYTKTALDFARTGRFAYNGWATAMLGWQTLWGALFIKLFGFSFNIVRLSTLPIAMASVYLMHRILVRFGLGPRNAILGCLTLGLSPLFFMIATTYLTDVPGVFAILLCLYMCQRSAVAKNHRTAVLWLVSAGLVNVIAGTVRQTSWLGVLIMVPSTAWLLRRNRGMLPAGIATALTGAAGVFACMRWAARQPFFVPEPAYVSPRLIHLLPLAGDYVKVLLCFLLVLIPIAAGSLPFLARIKPAAFLRIGILLCALPAFVAIHGGQGALAQWRAPWLIPSLRLQAALGNLTTTLLILSVLVPLIGFVFFEVVWASHKNPGANSSEAERQWHTALWLVGPFSFVYLCLLVPRASLSFVQDRYLLGIMPAAIILLLLLYERWIAKTLPWLSIALLGVFALYTMGATHDFYAELRASHTAVQNLLADGVPRTAIVEGFAPDLWEQLQVAGYVNYPKMVGATTYYNANVPPWPFPRECVNFVPQEFEPAIHPKYFIGYGPNPCFAPTNYPPATYRAWLPPVHRAKYVERILTNSELGQVQQK